jgi:hypothetical protein
MLRTEPKRRLSPSCRIFGDDTPVAVLETDRMRGAGRLILEEAVYSVYREGVVFGRFVLEREDGAVLATAEKPRLFARRLEVEHDGSTYVLRTASPLRRRFVLIEDDRGIGAIRPAHLFSRSALADLPEEVPLAVRIFMIRLVLLLRKRDMGNAGGGG